MPILLSIAVATTGVAAVVAGIVAWRRRRGRREAAEACFDAGSEAAIGIASRARQGPAAAEAVLGGGGQSGGGGVSAAWEAAGTAGAAPALEAGVVAGGEAASGVAAVAAAILGGL